MDLATAPQPGPLVEILDEGLKPSGTRYVCGTNRPQVDDEILDDLGRKHRYLRSSGRLIDELSLDAYPRRLLALEVGGDGRDVDDLEVGPRWHRRGWFRTVLSVARSSIPMLAAIPVLCTLDCIVLPGAIPTFGRGRSVLIRLARLTGKHEAEAGAGGPSPADRTHIIRALKAAGLEPHARDFAVEGLLALR